MFHTLLIRKWCNVRMIYCSVSLYTKDVTAHPYMALFLFIFVRQPYIFLIFQSVLYMYVQVCMYVCMYVPSTVKFQRCSCSNLAMSKALVFATNKTLKFNPFTYVVLEQFESLEPSQPHVIFVSLGKAK